ncbi:hypothetical protein ZWY2020_047323 [Hordeum vulgare]|nr:hypothetical protein ZWY2020_047323 [Hordeum vulgare]
MVAPGASGREKENRPGGEKKREEEGEERRGSVWCSNETVPTRVGVPTSLRWLASATGGRGGVHYPRLRCARRRLRLRWVDCRAAYVEEFMEKLWSKSNTSVVTK